MAIAVYLAYGVAVIAFVILSGVILYHLIRFGFFGDATKAMMSVFVVVGILLVVLSAMYVFSTPWSGIDLPSALPGTPSGNEPIFGNK